MSETVNFEIIAGTYEEYLLGYIFSSEDKTLVQSFASHDHSSSIRCLATCDKYLASGASDDRIIIYDLKARKEHCMLTHHDSTITTIAFTNSHSHVISASQDGTLAIVRVGNWQVEKLWNKAHKEGSVLDIAVHSSGKLALTLGTDGTIHTWNLVKGRIAYIINLKTKCKDPKSLEKIVFAPGDIKFVVYGGKYTEIWSIELGGVLQVIEHDQKVTCCAWLDSETIFVGYEDGNLGVVDLESGIKKKKLGHTGRVKAVQYLEGYIVTGSSTGEIKVWSRKLKELCKVSVGCRITCLIIAKWIGKLKKEEPEEKPPEESVSNKKPVNRTVIVEVDQSSSEEDSRSCEKLGKKRKKQKKNSIEATNEAVSKKKKKFAEPSINNTEVEINHESAPSFEEKMQRKITKKKKPKQISEVSMGNRKQKMKKKKKSIQS